MQSAKIQKSALAGKGECHMASDFSSAGQDDTFLVKCTSQRTCSCADSVFQGISAVRIPNIRVIDEHGINGNGVKRRLLSSGMVLERYVTEALKTACQLCFRKPSPTPSAGGTYV
jgi:hypothetical protein